jgi:hypothetical protein
MLRPAHHFNVRINSYHIKKGEGYFGIKIMIGLILCGGQSSRMGMDKGLLQFNGISWAQSAANKMAELNIPVYLSIAKHKPKITLRSFPHRLITGYKLTRYQGTTGRTVGGSPSTSSRGYICISLRHAADDSSVCRNLRDTYLRGEGFRGLCI